MQTTKVTFDNASGHRLSARLELPVHCKPYAYALFAHCFTCNKNLTAVRNIARALTRDGIAVLRFDFTGLGDSEGDFAQTTFSSNIEDLIAATHYLEEHYEAPSLLIGHSLGGAAVVAAAPHLPAVQAIITIGAPFDPSHVIHHFEEHLPEIEQSGEATVHVGGRPFTVKHSFLKDIREKKLARTLNTLDKALLIMHSPQDEIVNIDNAAQIYTYAKHPKSFISLDGANHLLSDKADSNYAGEVVASWVKKYIPAPLPKFIPQEKTVTVSLNAENGYTSHAQVRHHQLVADEPTSVGGHDFGPNPYEFLAIGLGACTAMTLMMYARRKGWDLQSVLVDLDHLKDHATDCEAVENPKQKIDFFHRQMKVTGNLDDHQINRLLEIADKCPVHKTLESKAHIKSTIQKVS